MNGAFLAVMLGAAGAWGETEFLKNMHKAEGRREPEERIEYYSRALRAWEPSDGSELLANCHFRRGEARFERYEFDEAEPDLSKSIELDPGNARAYLLRGRVHLRRGRAAEAARDFSAYTAFSPQDIEGFLALGEARQKNGQFNAALRAYDRGAALDPSDWRPAFGVGRAWMARKRWEQALEQLDKADEAARHSSPEVLSERAVCRVALGQHQKASYDYNDAIAVHDRKLQDMARARAMDAAVVEYQIQVARAYFGRGRLNEFLVRPREAIADYVEACRLGHKEACGRAEALAGRAEVKPKAAAPKEKGPETPKKVEKRRKRLPKPGSESGERIYAN